MYSLASICDTIATGTNNARRYFPIPGNVATPVFGTLWSPTEFRRSMQRLVLATWNSNKSDYYGKRGSELGGNGWQSRLHPRQLTTCLTEAYRIYSVCAYQLLSSEAMPTVESLQFNCSCMRQYGSIMPIRWDVELVHNATRLHARVNNELLAQTNK